MAAAFVEAGWSQLHSLGALSDDSAPLNFVSVAQLVTIEYLATQDGQHAVVRERAEGVAEVVTGGERGLELHLVTRDGSVSLLDKSGRHAPPGGTLAGKAIRAYGGRRENWAEVDLRPSD
jgi:hypothetical protein